MALSSHMEQRTDRSGSTSFDNKVSNPISSSVEQVAMNMPTSVFWLTG